jgi:hypothetical protein
MAEENKNLDQQFQSEGFAKSFGGDYTGSSIQQQNYDRLNTQDKIYSQFILQNYGSYDNYMQMHRIGQTSAVYDPSIDYVMDVTVVTENQSYKSDHISTQEVIMEALSGVCTVIFMKINGSVGRITGTLERSYIPTSEYQTRLNFFSPLKGDRIVVWDINKQGWRSFYMDRVIKFVRDDTIGLE